MNRTQCLIKVQNMLKGNQTTPVDLSNFWPANSTLLTIDPENPAISLRGCDVLCGGQRRWYGDIGQRYFTWLLPVVLLVANMHVSPLDKQRYLEPLMLLGDPITSFWSLLTKVDAWVLCHNLAVKSELQGTNKKDVGTLLAGIEEITGLESNPLEELQVLFPQLSYSLPYSEEFSLPQIRLPRQLLKRTAFKLARGKTDDILRTSFAVSLYILQLAAGFDDVLGGGNDTPPGGRIGTAMLLTWLIPAVLLSNVVGGLATRDTCFETMKELKQECTTSPRERITDLGIESSAAEYSDENVDLKGGKRTVNENGDGAQLSPLQKRLQDPEEFYRSQRWTGATYIYRHEKPYQSGKPSWMRRAIIIFLSVLPVTIASGFGSAIMWNTPPNGLNCRGTMLLLITLAWYISAGLTSIIWKVETWAVLLPSNWNIWHAESWSWHTKGLSAQAQWRLIVYKDAIIAVPCVLVIFLSSAGLFNTCFCWSASFSWGAEAHLPLNTNFQFELNDKTIYPILAGTCVGLQFLVFSLMVWMGWHGLRLMAWTEKEKERRWTE